MTETCACGEPGHIIAEHEARMAALAQRMPGEETLYNLSDFYRVLGDSTRVRILFALSDGPLCVCHIAEFLGMTQSAVSHQLRVLKQARLVQGRRQGKQIAYALMDEHVQTVFAQGIAHITERHGSDEDGEQTGE